MKRSLLTFVALSSLLWTSACPQPVEKSALGSSRGSAFSPSTGSADGKLVAKVGELKLTVPELERRINAQSPFVRARFDSPERVTEFVENQIRFEVLALEAFARDLHEDAEIQESLKKILVQKLTRQEFDSLSLQDVTDAEMRTYFDAHTEEYNKPAMVRASHILIPFGDNKDAAKALAERVRKQAADPTTISDRGVFQALVTEHSKDAETVRTGGDLRYLTAAEWEQRFGPTTQQALFASDTANEVLPVMESAQGFHIVKRTGRRKPIERTYEQVSNQIRNVLYREKRSAAFDAFIDGLKKKHGVQFEAASVSDIRVKQDPGHAPMVGGDQGPAEPSLAGSPADDR